MDIIVKKTNELTKTEYRACYVANYGSGGYMQDSIVRYKHKDTATVIMLWDGPADKVTSLKAWSLMLPINDEYYGGTKYARSKTKHSVQLWVKSQYRRQGLGTVLMNEAKKIEPIPYVFPHCEVSGRFYSQHKVVADQGGRKWTSKKFDKAG